tara:strand:+ start:402 stop:521 length:120 start_codon:yes stop_codon:yes gene_type:complete
MVFLHKKGETPIPRGTMFPDGIESEVKNRDANVPIGLAD